MVRVTGVSPASVPETRVARDSAGGTLPGSRTEPLAVWTTGGSPYSGDTRKRTSPSTGIRRFIAWVPPFGECLHDGLGKSHHMHPVSMGEKCTDHARDCLTGRDMRLSLSRATYLQRATLSVYNI